MRPGALAVNQANGLDTRWLYNQRLNLTYCVSTAFGANYSRVVQAMNSAASAWHAAANVRFVYVSAQDGAYNASNANVPFRCP